MCYNRSSSWWIWRRFLQLHSTVLCDKFLSSVISGCERVSCYRVPWSVWDFFYYFSWCPCLPPVDIALCFVEHCSLFRELMCAAAAHEHSASWCWIMGTLCASTAVFCFVIFIVICKFLTKTRQTVTTYWWWWLRMALRFSGWMVRVKFPFSS